MLEFFRMCFLISLRNWTVYKKDFLANVSPTVADPALILVSLGLGLGAFLTDVQGMSYMEFLAPGLIIATALFTSFFESSYSFYVRMTFENIFKAMLTTPIGINEIVFGELIWVGLKGALMAFGVSIVLSLFGLMSNVYLLPMTALVGAMVAIPCGAMGLIASALVRNINQFQTVYSFVIAPLFYLSGIFFPIDNMNVYVRGVAELFPVIHGVRLAQSLFWSKGIMDTVVYNGGILVIQTVVLSFIALVLVRRKLIL